MNESITNRQISFMIFAALVGYGIINLPNKAAAEAGAGAWIPLAINTIVIAFFVYLISYLGYNNENQTLYEYGQKIVGKTLGKIMVAIYVVFSLMVASYLVRSYSGIVVSIFLPRTPVWAVSLFLLLVVGYGISKDLGTIARLTEIYITIVIIGFVIIQIILATQGEMVNIRPISGTGDIVTYVKATGNLFLSFTGPEILMFIPMNKKKNKNITRYSVLSIVLVGILYIFVVESTISAVGVEDVVYYDASIFKVLQGIDLVYLELLRRLDGYYLIFWTMNLFCDVCIVSYILSEQSKKVFKRLPSKINSISIIVIIFILSQIPKTPSEMEIVTNILRGLGAVILLIIPLVLFMVMKVKKNGKKT